MTLDDPALHGCITWYSQSCYDHFDRLGFDAANEIAQVANDQNGKEPLLIRNKKGEFNQFELPYIGKKSGPYLVALMSAFLVWTQRQLVDNPLPDSPMLAAAHDGLKLWWLSYPEKAPKWERIRQVITLGKTSWKEKKLIHGKKEKVNRKTQRRSVGSVRRGRARSSKKSAG